jgi:hypothetical protein
MDPDSWFHIINYLDVNSLKSLSKCNNILYAICHNRLQKMRNNDEFLFHRCFADISDNGRFTMSIERLIKYTEKLAEERKLNVNKIRHRQQYKSDIILIPADKGVRIVIAATDCFGSLGNVHYGACGMDFGENVKADRMCMIGLNEFERPRELYLFIDPVKMTGQSHFDILFIILSEKYHERSTRLVNGFERDIWVS